MHLILAVFIIILLIILIFDINKEKMYELKRNVEFAMSLPGASIFSSFVNSLEIAFNYKELLNYVDSITKKYGNRTRLILGTDVFVVLAKPEGYKLVLSNENGNNKNSITKTWEMLLGDGIIRASGPTHKLRRKIIQPLLNIKYLSEYVTFFDTYSNLYADILEKYIDGPMFDLKPYIARYSLNIYLETMVGIHGSACEREYDELSYCQEKLMKNAHRKMIKPWLQFERIFSMTENRKQLRIVQKNMLDFIYSIIPQKKAASHTVLQDNNEVFEKSIPVFHKYYNHMEKLRNSVVRNESCEISDKNFSDDVRNFYFVIQNTITEMICFTTLMLAMHIEVQEKLREEIFVTFSNNKVDAQRLLNMKYFHVVYQETLRLFPLAPVIMRQLTGDISLLRKRTLPISDSCTLRNGCYVMIPIFTIHRNPAYWNKPMEFIPERFSAENWSKQRRYTYIPFGTGLRDCLGQRYAFLCVATIIVSLLRRYRFVNNKSNIDDIKLTSDILLRTQDTKFSISSV